MATEIPKQYDPADAQQRWYAEWSERGYFDAEPNPQRSQHTIMIPLPNVTGALHMGHALNGTLQDLITRFDDPGTPYEARPRPAQAPRYSAYEHLARIKEWTPADSGEDA